ncbi:hypothetical protein TNCV_2825671 [Trichonephila clavipes]|nr:hypothetical protein TNCV_2825671 [Trichonephila clavipes]
MVFGKTMINTTAPLQNFLSVKTSKKYLVNDGGSKSACLGSVKEFLWSLKFLDIRENLRTAMAGSDVVQSGRPIFDDFFQHLWLYIGNNTANVVFQMVKRLWLIHIDQ